MQQRGGLRGLELACTAYYLSYALFASDVTFSTCSVI